MAKILKTNKSLIELDLSSNRVNFDAFRLLLAGLLKNTTLKVLKACGLIFLFLLKLQCTFLNVSDKFCKKLVFDWGFYKEVSITR